MAEQTSQPAPEDNIINQAELDAVAAVFDANKTSDSGEGSPTGGADQPKAEVSGTVAPAMEEAIAADAGAAPDAAPADVSAAARDATRGAPTEPDLGAPPTDAGPQPSSAEAAPPAVLGAVTAGASPEQAQPLAVPELSEAGAAAETSIELLDDVELEVKIELGRTSLYIEDVLKLGVGSVLELDKLAGDPVDIYVNDRLVARGEVLVLNDNFCVRINDIRSPVPELEEG